MNKAHPSLAGLLVDLDVLVPLPGNPRSGDVEAIAASLDEFGQLKPIVIRANPDGTHTVIAGNHTAEAARSLGWTQIAAVDAAEFDDRRAVAFALTDNRINELGSTDPSLLHEAITAVIDDYAPTFEVLGWDDFEMAAMDEHVEFLAVNEDRDTGYTPPVLVEREARLAPEPVSKSEPSHIDAPVGIDQRSAVTMGSTAVGQAGAKAIVQYSLVFDSADQQRRWYDFMRWLRTDPGTAGETNAERLLDFLEARADF
jgi:hypothetical protein